MHGQVLRASGDRDGRRESAVGTKDWCRRETAVVINGDERLSLLFPFVPCMHRRHSLGARGRLYFLSPEPAKETPFFVEANHIGRARDTARAARERGRAPRRQTRPRGMLEGSMRFVSGRLS